MEDGREPLLGGQGAGDRDLEAAAHASQDPGAAAQNYGAQEDLEGVNSAPQQTFEADSSETSLENSPASSYVPPPSSSRLSPHMLSPSGLSVEVDFGKNRDKMGRISQIGSDDGAENSRSADDDDDTGETANGDDTDGNLTSAYASFYDVGSDGSHTPRPSMDPDTVESASAATTALRVMTSLEGHDESDANTEPPSSGVSSTPRLLMPTPSHMFESFSDSEDDFGPSYRDLLHDYEEEQRQAAVLNEALRAKERYSTCSFMRSYKCLFLGIFLILVIASGVVAVLCWFRLPVLNIMESHVRFDSLSKRQTLNGTQIFQLQNPNYLSLKLESLSVTVFYYSHITMRWYQFDDTGDDIAVRMTLAKMQSGNFTETFSYRIRSTRVASALLMQCVDGHVDLAFRGYATYKFVGQSMVRDFGPVILSSDCVLSSD